MEYKYLTFKYKRGWVLNRLDPGGTQEILGMTCVCLCSTDSLMVVRELLEA